MTQPTPPDSLGQPLSAAGLDAYQAGWRAGARWRETWPNNAWPNNTGALLAELSAWIDDAPANALRDPEARTWGRLAKIVEEAGEVVAAYIGATGQNPRKGVTHALDDVREELLDVAVTALAAYEHMTSNQGTVIRALRAHVEALIVRVNETRSVNEARS